MPTVDPPTCSLIPATEKMTENMMIVATSAITVSRTTIIADAFTME